MRQGQASDHLSEMIDLCLQSMSELKQQMDYYKASVYKDEAAKQVTHKIEALRTSCLTLGMDQLREPFCDYDAEVKNPHPSLFPGECQLSARIARLLNSLEKEIHRLSAEENAHPTKWTSSVGELFQQNEDPSRSPRSRVRSPGLF